MIKKSLKGVTDLGVYLLFRVVCDTLCLDWLY